jgi:hypothetical protein
MMRGFWIGSACLDCSGGNCWCLRCAVICGGGGGFTVWCLVCGWTCVDWLAGLIGAGWLNHPIWAGGGGMGKDP